MATEVYTTRKITLQDDNNTEVVLKPVTLRYQRHFMKAWDKITEAEGQDDAFDVYVNCAGIGMQRQLSKVVKLHDSEGKEDKDAKHVDPDTGELHSEYKEYLEDTLDLETINVILEVTGGLKLTPDPKVLEDAANSLRESDGKTSI